MTLITRVVLLIVCMNVALPIANSQVPASDMKIAGTALYRYWGFRLYQATLSSDCVVKEAVWNETCAYNLRLQYKRTFTPENFIESSEKMLRRIYGESFKDIQKEFSLFSKYFKEVNEGDEYLLQYKPDEGMTLLLNGAVQGKPTSKSFAEAYFSIWLSEKGIDEDNARKLWTGEE